MSKLTFNIFGSESEKKVRCGRNKGDGTRGIGEVTQRRSTQLVEQRELHETYAYSVQQDRSRPEPIAAALHYNGGIHQQPALPPCLQSSRTQLAVFREWIPEIISAESILMSALFFPPRPICTHCCSFAETRKQRCSASTLCLHAETDVSTWESPFGREAPCVSEGDTSYECRHRLLRTTSQQTTHNIHTNDGIPIGLRGNKKDQPFYSISSDYHAHGDGGCVPAVLLYEPRNLPGTERVLAVSSPRQQ